MRRARQDCRARFYGQGQIVNGTKVRPADGGPSGYDRPLLHQLVRAVPDAGGQVGRNDGGTD
ncbi:hypothetical protein PG1C_09230 [Rugosibacter aromaticivorans]|uniref:Uncharacterized protein n=1 Tax=Rugosibacter aromaticivorans TaxID=1565605 RepID=A0A0C5JMI3_9PROT|nr:hypothetical protein PG1C_09230 [Rugosibacter aromaticivorans]